MTDTALDDPHRFGFGANWTQFLAMLDDDRIAEATASLKEMLGVETLAGRSFLDIGNGSGLFSLAARKLGARVHSFDYDLQSVNCARELKRRYFPDDPEWVVEQGSALDPDFMKTLGQFDIVYSWGVLHHTGAMWLGLELASQRVAPAGTLFVALYNDQGFKSRLWWFIKYIYNKLPRPLATVYAYALGSIVYALNILRHTFRLRPMEAIRPMRNYKKKRGMSLRRDLVDWMGGFPFEFVRNDVYVAYMKSKGFRVVRSKPATSLGCHEWVAMRE